MRGVAGWSPVEFYMKLSIRNSVTAFSPAPPGKPVASSMVISLRMGVIIFFVFFFRFHLMIINTLMKF